MERLSALAGAGVPPRVARLRRAGMPHELGREVLDLKFTGLEFGRQVQVHRPPVAPGRKMGRGDQSAGEDGRCAVPEALFDRADLVDLRPYPERGFALELSQKIRRE